jgi:hypothetical protein
LALEHVKKGHQQEADDDEKSDVFAEIIQCIRLIPGGKMNA